MTLFRILSWLPTVLALLAIAGFVVFVQKFGWDVPNASALRGEAPPEKDDWCGTHSVPESVCIECNADLLPRDKPHGRCRPHGLDECVVCTPGLAQSPSPMVTDDDRARIAAALAFTPRPENGGKCKLHLRRIQFSSAAMLDTLGVDVAAAVRSPMSEFVDAAGELGFDPSRVVRLSSRVPGTLWRVGKKIGDCVAVGEVLAVVEAAEVGKRKAEFLQTLVRRNSSLQTAAALRGMTDAVSTKAIQDADAGVLEAQLRLVAARQALMDLGLSLPEHDYENLSPEAVSERLHALGLPAEWGRSATSSNLVAIRTPIAGEIIEASGGPGDAVDPARKLFVVADPRRMRLTVHVRSEDIDRVQPGQAVRFTHDGHAEGDVGTVVGISPGADEITRTIPVRVAWPTASDHHPARIVGIAQIAVRQESYATVVPSAAVHYEGDCHIVFVRDKDFDSAPYKLFHVRKVRPASVAEGTTEVVGILPGEIVATTNSGILRSALLTNNLGAGCGCGH